MHACVARTILTAFIIINKRCMTFHIDIQHASSTETPINDQKIIDLANLVLHHEKRNETELTIRLVDVDEITFLNTTYRHQPKPTNVLAFPSQLPAGVELEYHFLGDVIICPEILQQESVTLNKSLESHWALIVIHGILHLLGYDHIKDDEAITMQAIEIKLLKQLGFDNPYDEDEHLE